MLCSSCRRREPIDGFKTCPDCRKAKRRYYQRKKEKIQDDINHYNVFTEKSNYYVDYVKYAVGKINENTHHREHIENIKKIMEFFDIYYERDLYINELLNSIKNDEILKELKEH